MTDNDRLDLRDAPEAIERRDGGTVLAPAPDPDPDPVPAPADPVNTQVLSRSALEREYRAAVAAADDGAGTPEALDRADALAVELERRDRLDAHRRRVARPVRRVDDLDAARRSFSIRRAVADALQLRGRADAGLEREVSAEIVRRDGPVFEGVPIPLEALGTRATVTGSGATGVHLVADDYRPAEYIPLLYDALVTGQLGVRVLRGLTGDVEIPKALSGATGSWLSESGTAPTRDLSFAAPVTLSPKKLAMIGQWSARLMLQASPDVEQLFRADFSASIARTLDTGILEGTGTSDQPTGILTAVTRTGRTTGGGDANGKTLTMAEILDLVLDVDTDNVEGTSRGFLLSPRLRNWAMQQLKFSSAGSDTLWANEMLLGMRSVVSNIAPTLDRGTATAADTLMYGQWSDCVVGVWQDLDLLINPYASAAFGRGDIQLRAMLHADVALRRTESFEYYDGVLTS